MTIFRNSSIYSLNEKDRQNLQNLAESPAWGNACLLNQIRLLIGNSIY